MSKFNVDEILAKADLRELVRKAGGQLDSHGRCACPLHGGDNDSAFSVFTKDGRDGWYCFTGPSCGGGDAITFVEKWQNLDFKRACEFLGGDIVSDPVAIEASAKIRFEEAQKKHEEARLKMEARRHELQQAQLHLHYHNTMKDWGRQKWLEAGIDESWQGFWYLGSCDRKTIMYKGAEYHTPTLTIPLLGMNSELLNIKHRLINPPKPNDKYRPERDGLGSFPPFVAFTDIGYNAELIWIVEGEKKAMVLATISPSATWQFIGVPGQDAFDKLPVEELRSRRVIVVPDPGGESKPWAFTKQIGARFLMTTEKIDDMVVANEYDANWLNAMSKQARKP